MSEARTKAEQRARHLLDAIPNQGDVGVTTSELVEITGIPRSAIYYPLRKLRTEGHIVQGEEVSVWHRALTEPKTDWSALKPRPTVGISFRVSPDTLADPEFQRVFKKYTEN